MEEIEGVVGPRKDALSICKFFPFYVLFLPLRLLLGV